MPRIYRPPNFNVKCAVWERELPANLAGWRALRPDRAPDLVSACQLYYPRYGVGRWLHAFSASVQDTLLKSGFQELRLPKGTVINAPWIVTPFDDWRLVPIVEVPRWSGRFYAVVMADVAHVGFPNEYVVALLSQIAAVPAGGRFGAGAVLRALVGPTSPAARLTGGSALLSTVSGSTFAARLHGGSALVASVTPFHLLAELHGGSALVATVVPLGVLARLHGGSALNGVGSGTGLPAKLHGGAALHVVGSGIDLPARLHAGSALNGVSTSAGMTAQLHGGSALNGVGSGTGLPAKLHGGSALNGVGSGTGLPAKLHGGAALTATVTSGGGSTAPSTTCAGAPLVTLPFSQTQATNTTDFSWWKFTWTGGVVHIRVTQVGAFYNTGNLYTGACGGLQTLEAHVDSITHCMSATIAAGTVFIRLDPNLSGASSDIIEVAAGSC